MGLGIIPVKETIDLSQLRWFGHLVRTGNEIHPKMAWQARIKGGVLKKDANRLGKKGHRRF
jgi:hypothetical protein